MAKAKMPSANDFFTKFVAMRDWKKRVQVPLRGSGIRRRLLLWGLSLFGIALTVVVVVGYFYTVRQIERSAADLQAELATVTADRIRNFVRRKIERFSDAADAASLYPLGSKEQRLLFGLLVKNDNSFSEAAIIDARGMEVVKVSDRKVFFPADLSDQSKSEKFTEAMKGTDYISRVHTSDRAQPYVTIAIPLWGAAQSIVGVAAAEADLSFLWEVIGKIQFGTAGNGYLVDENGNLIAHKDAALVLKQTSLRQVFGVQKFLQNPSRADSAPAKEGPGLSGRRVLTTYAPLPELGWAIVLEEPVDAALASVEILKRSALVLLAVSLLVGAAAIAWVSGEITGPIRDLHEGAKIIGRGNLDYRVDIKTGDEIEWLAEEFNKMAAELKVSYATLEQKVRDKTSELGNANQELEELNRNLLKANKAKDEFLSVMSHELRTPLNVVMGYTGMMKEGLLGSVNPEQSRALEKVIARSSDLLIMISQILQATSIEAGKVKVERQEFDLNHFLEGLKTNYELPMNKAVTVDWEYSAQPLTLKTDSGKLKHILQNLINNAIKFTEKGYVRVAAHHLPHAQRVQFEVADTGIGIHKEMLPSIFEIFHQIDSSETRSYGGVGLGLYIVKKYTELLGGTIEAQSEFGKGTTFTLEIPC